MALASEVADLRSNASIPVTEKGNWKLENRK
jgi:hypothetical protein